MTRKTKPEVDWCLTTWKGSRLQQHREFQALPFARKLEVMDELQATAESLQKAKPVKAGSPPVRKS